MLIRSNETLLEFAELTATIQFASVKSTIRLVENQHLVPVLGKELYDSLDAAYTTSLTDPTASPLTALQTSLLEKCRCVIGPMLCYYYTPKAEVKLSNAGAQRLETTTNKTAFQNQVVNFREQNLREGEIATEQLLEFLETWKVDLPTWVNSEAFKEYRKLFIKSGKEFDTLFSSASPYRNYWAMRSKMLEVEQGTIRTMLGEDLFAALKTKDNATTPAFNNEEKELIFKLKKAIAYATVALSIPFLNVRIDANGITIQSNARATNDELAKRGPAGVPILNTIIQKCEAAAGAWVNNVAQYLNDHLEAFTGLWPVITAYEQNIIDRRVEPDRFNEQQGGSYGLF
jgi:hypothetical protein